MSRYGILLFDADNTLFDFDRAEYLSFRHTAETEGLPFSETLYRRYSEINDSLWKRIERNEITLEFLKKERFRLLLLSLGESDDSETDRRAELLRDCYIGALGEQTCLIDGAEEVCRALAERYRLYLVTNGIAQIQRRRFERSVLRPYFRDIFISEELGAAKPSKAYFDEVFRRIGQPEKQRVLMIGDSLTSDCDGAIACGLDICRYNPDGKPDNGRILTYTVKKLSELSDLLAEEGLL